MGEVNTTGKLVTLVQITDVSQVIEETPRDDIEKFATAISPEAAVAWLARAIDFADGLNFLIAKLQARVATEQDVWNVVGGEWTDPVTHFKYAIKHGGRTGFKDIPGLYDVLNVGGGLSTKQFIGAITDLRVTDLRAAANALPGEKKKELLEKIEEFRGFKPSAPKLARVDED